MKKVNKFDKAEWNQLQKLVQKIVSNPSIGKPMKYDRKGTREVYFPPFRLSYKYDSQEDCISFLDLYHKKFQ